LAHDGRDLEKLVALIERSVSPGTVVQHDVHLPVLTSTVGAKCQCDVVVIRDPGPRQTLTIIEVQDRGRQVVPNDVRGWMGKMKEVGAQHLIAVSRREYSRSVKERASQSGGSIRLVTLETLDCDSFPVDFVYFEFSFVSFEVISYDQVSLFAPGLKELPPSVATKFRSKTGFDSNEYCFSEDGVHRLSAYQLCRRALSLPDEDLSGTTEFKFNIPMSGRLYVHVDEHALEIGLSFTASWENEVFSMPVQVLEYRQDGHGALAWVAAAELERPEGTYRYRAPFTRTDGGFVMRDVEIESPVPSVLTLSEKPRSS
jgi:hypothetical protein